MYQLEKGKYLGHNEKSFDMGCLTINETVYHDNVFEGWHSHQNCHITFFLTGGTREQRKNLEFESAPGCITFYNSAELHRNFNTKHPSRNINIEIDNDFFSSYQINPASFPSASLNSPCAKFTVLKIYQEARLSDAFSQESIHSLLLNLLAAIPSKKPEKINPKWVELVKTILHDRWNENITLTELAKLVQVHPVTISKFFPKYFSCSMGEYCRDIRTVKAISLIKNSSLSLTQIGYYCGFYDQSHFIKSFKRKTGFKPKEFKKL